LRKRVAALVTVLIDRSLCKVYLETKDGALAIFPRAMF